MKDMLPFVVTVNTYGEKIRHCAALARLRSRSCAFPRSLEPSNPFGIFSDGYSLSAKLLELICCCDRASIIFLHNRSYLFLCPC